MKPALLVATVCLLTACATTHQPAYYYNEIRVLNNSSQILRNLSIRVPATGGEFTCGNIAPRGLCSNRFGARKYQYNPIQIEWTYGNGPVRTQDFTVPIPATFSLGLKIQGVVEVSDTGEMQVYFEQESGFI